MFNIIEWPILSVLIFTPIVGGALSALIKNNGTSRTVAIIFALINMLVTGLVLFNFNYSLETMQFIEKIPFSVHMNINYFVGIDGIALSLIVLTNFIMLLILIYEKNRSHLYYSSFLVLQGVTIGLFSCLDALMFYILLESSLVVMFFIIALWGGENRMKAVFKYCLYSFLAGSFLLVAMIYIQSKLGNFNILDWQILIPELFSNNEKIWLFWIFVIAFGVKVPLFGVHFWLPQAHSQAPTGGSVFLSGILLKLGVFAFIRFVLPIFPDMIQQNMNILMAVALIGIIYSSLLALIEKEDIKRIIAYSSIAHMGFIMLGLFSLNQLALQGALMQIVSHALAASGLFFTVGIVFDRLNSRKLKDMTALQSYMPKLAVLFMVLFLDASGLPITGGFIGKFASLLGVFEVNKIVVIVSLVGIILSIAYLLRFYNVVFCSSRVLKTKIEDLNLREFVVLLSIVLSVLLIGIKPNIVFDLTETATHVILNIN